MLKITTTPDSQRLVLEGSLSGPWVETLEQSWWEALSRHEPRAITIDLTEMTFVDQKGRDLLAAIYAQGGVLSGRGIFSVSLIHDIESAQRGKESGGNPLASWIRLLALLVPSVVLLAACSTAGAVEPQATVADFLQQAERPLKQVVARQHAVTKERARPFDRSGSGDLFTPREQWNLAHLHQIDSDRIVDVIVAPGLAGFVVVEVVRLEESLQFVGVIQIDELAIVIQRQSR